MSYFDVHAILCEEERVPAQFVAGATKLGYLDAGSTEADLEADAEVDIPLWLAATLAQQGLVRVAASRVAGFSGSFRDNLEAEPQSLSFGRHQYYYETGASLALCARDPDLLERLVRAFAARCSLLLDSAQNLRGPDVADLKHRFSVSELNLFTATHDAYLLLDWHRGSR